VLYSRGTDIAENTNHVITKHCWVVTSLRLRGSVFTEPLPRSGLHNPVVPLLSACNAGCLSSRCLAMRWHVTVLKVHYKECSSLCAPTCLPTTLTPSNVCCPQAPLCRTAAKHRVDSIFLQPLRARSTPNLGGLHCVFTLQPSTVKMHRFYTIYVSRPLCNHRNPSITCSWLIYMRGVQL
jgi:hypothetical protein